jgi:hypothetical protein
MESELPEPEPEAEPEPAEPEGLGPQPLRAVRDRTRAKATRRFLFFIKCFLSLPENREQTLSYHKSRSGASPGEVLSADFCVGDGLCGPADY